MHGLRRAGWGKQERRRSGPKDAELMKPQRNTKEHERVQRGRPQPRKDILDRMNRIYRIKSSYASGIAQTDSKKPGPRTG
jgi:hypothetical protein